MEHREDKASEKISEFGTSKHCYVFWQIEDQYMKPVGQLTIILCYDENCQYQVTCYSLHPSQNRNEKNIHQNVKNMEMNREVANRVTRENLRIGHKYQKMRYDSKAQTKKEGALVWLLKPIKEGGWKFHME